MKYLVFDIECCDGKHTVGEYMKAHKLFQVDDLDKEDFPSL